MKIVGFILTTIVLLTSVSHAQEEARAAWQITKFDITANIQQAERALDATALISATNVGRGVGTSFPLRIHNKAPIKSVSVGGAVANFRAVPETYASLQRVTVTLPS